MNRTVALAAGGAGVLVAFYAIWVASNPKPKVSEEGERAAPAATAEASAAEKQRVAEEKALAGLKAAQERGAKAVTGSPGTGSKPVVTKAGSSSSSSSSSSSTKRSLAPRRGYFSTWSSFHQTAVVPAPLDRAIRYVDEAKVAAAQITVHDSTTVTREAVGTIEFREFTNLAPCR